MTKKGRVRTFRTQGCEVGLTPPVVAIDELGAVGFCASKEKAELSLLTQIALKVSSSGVILVVASQFASVDTIPNAVGLTFDKNSSQLCAC